MDVPDRLEKQAVLRAPLARVWSALSDVTAFGAWFGAELDGPFVAGTRVTGRIRPTTVDPEVAKLQAPHAGTPFVLHVERVEPPHRLAFRWHPYPPAAGAEANAPTTLVELELAEVEGGTLLRVRESGFAALPPGRREQAFTANEGGWAHQLRLVARYLEGHAP